MSPSAVFIFGDLNVHHNDWLAYSGGTDWPGDRVHIIFLSQMILLTWLTFLLGSQTVILIILPFGVFSSSDASISSTMAFPPLGNSDHVVSVTTEFPINSKRNALFHCIAYDYSCAGWDALCDHWRISLNLVLLLLLVNFVSSGWN